MTYQTYDQTKCMSVDNNVLLKYNF